MLKIKTGKVKNTEITVPGSKSYTHRTFIAAALSDGECRVENWLDSEDTNYTLNALQQFGVSIEKRDDAVYIKGCTGELEKSDVPIFLGNSGTSMRLLTSYAAIGKGIYTLSGTKRMHERPIQHLLDGLQEIGVRAVSVNNNGCPPVTINGGNVIGGTINLDCSISSQFLSGLLLIAPYTEKGLKINISKGPVSKPYIDMTVDIMSQFGVQVSRDKYNYFEVPGKQHYKKGNYLVESDCSQASYFWAAAAIGGSTIKVKGISKLSKQGDVKFAEVLSSMGCRVDYENDGISVTGADTLVSTTADMADMPDIVPTLAVVSAFAKGTTVIKNVSHLKVKESDRLAAVINELSKMGIESRSEGNDLIVKGGNPKGAVIETYDDHRIAMCFSIAGLHVPGIEIKNENCVEKSFPSYWQVFNELYE